MRPVREHAMGCSRDSAKLSGIACRMRFGFFLEDLAVTYSPAS